MTKIVLDRRVIDLGGFYVENHNSYEIKRHMLKRIGMSAALAIHPSGLDYVPVIEFREYSDHSIYPESIILEAFLTFKDEADAMAFKVVWDGQGGPAQ